MYADLEESFGDYNSTKLVYDRIVDLKIATPQIILNYSLFLEENQYFEESFKVRNFNFCYVFFFVRLTFSEWSYLKFYWSK